MAKGCVLLSVVTMLWAPVALAAIGQANGVALGAPEWVPGPNPQAPVTAQHEGTIGRAGEAIAAAVGIPDDVRERLLGQVGGQLGRQHRADAPGAPETSETSEAAETSETPSVVGLDLAALRTAHANAMGNRPDSVAGLDNAAPRLPERARERLRLVPIQWIGDHLAPEAPAE